MATRGMVTRGELLDAAWAVAQMYRAYRAYGSERAACRALARRRPGLTDRRYRNAFLEAVTLYDAASSLVQANATALHAQTDVAADRFPDFRGLASGLRFSGFHAGTVRAALLWVFFWEHLK